MEGWESTVGGLGRRESGMSGRVLIGPVWLLECGGWLEGALCAPACRRGGARLGIFLLHSPWLSTSRWTAIVCCCRLRQKNNKMQNGESDQDIPQPPPPPPWEARRSSPSAWKQFKAVLYKNWLLRLKGGCAGVSLPPPFRLQARLFSTGHAEQGMLSLYLKQHAMSLHAYLPYLHNRRRWFGLGGAAPAVLDILVPVLFFLVRPGQASHWGTLAGQAMAQPLGTSGRHAVRAGRLEPVGCCARCRSLPLTRPWPACRRLARSCAFPSTMSSPYPRRASCPRHILLTWRAGESCTWVRAGRA